MSGRPWDRLPVDLGDSGCWVGGERPVSYRRGPGTKCKHGDAECERCGTSERVDRVHSTDEDGLGRVGRLLRRW